MAYLQQITDATQKALAASEREAAAAARAEAMAQEVAATAREAAAAAIRAVWAEAKLEHRSLELLRIKGRLSMRGVIDYIEDELKTQRVGYEGLSRLELWRKVLKGMLQLQTCLAQPDVFDSHYSHAAQRLTEDDLARHLVDVYKTLCSHIHSNKSAADYKKDQDKLEIVEGQLSSRQCRALECICKVFGFPTELYDASLSLLSQCQSWRRSLVRLQCASSCR